MINTMVVRSEHKEKKEQKNCRPIKLNQIHERPDSGTEMKI